MYIQKIIQIVRVDKNMIVVNIHYLFQSQATSDWCFSVEHNNNLMCFLLLHFGQSKLNKYDIPGGHLCYVFGIFESFSLHNFILVIFCIRCLWWTYDGTESIKTLLHTLIFTPKYSPQLLWLRINGTEILQPIYCRISWYVKME